MEQQGEPIQTITQEAGTTKQGFRPIWILWGCGGMLGLFLMMLLAFFLVAKGAMKVGEREFSPACDVYFAKVQSSDYTGAYQDFIPEMKASVKEADYIALDRGIHERLGALKSKTVQAVQTGVDQNGRWGVIIYDGVFEKGKGTIRIQLKKVGKDYKIAGVYYYSPILAEAFKSQHP